MSGDLRAFLEHFRPDGYTTFVGIVPDGTTVAATFNGADPGEAQRWITSQNCARGVYFTVNPTPPGLRKKPTKGDITAIAGVWADVDPRDSNRGEWLAERERLLALTEELIALPWRPSLIVDSGNGIQPVWLLTEQLKPTPEYRHASEALCRRVEAALGAQGTHNIDRLLRVPGTTNFPNPKKKRQGRGETRARLLHASWNRYSWRNLEDLATFLESNPPQHAQPITPATPQGNGADQQTSALTPEALADLRKALAGDAMGGWHDAMLRIVARLVHDGASDWFIRDWGLQYRWPEYSEAETLREIDTMIAGARAKGYHKARKQGVPAIDVVGGNFAKNIRAAISALQQRDVQIYNRGGQLVRPVTQGAVTGTGGDGIRRPLGSMTLGPVSPDWLRMQLAEVAAWRKYDSRTEKWKPTDPSPDIARTIVAAPDEGRWPYLRAIVRHPVLLPSGRRITAQGYDTETGLLIDAPGGWPPLPDNPTREDAQAAVDAIQHLLRFFPWSSDTDCAVALSLILTGLASPILDAVPGHGVDAPAAGTGKTILVNAAAIVMTGAEAATLDYGQNPEEAAKRIDSALLAGDPMLCIDNIEVALEGAALCQTITQAVRRLRLLGSNAMVTVPCNTFITATGNNICLRGDIVRRMLLCRLDAGVERPEEREITQDLLTEVRESRGEIVRCAQTIMLAYICAGRPKFGLTPIGSFDDWSDLVRAPLVWAGTADPVTTIARARADDPSVQALGAVLSAWFDACGSEPVTVASLIGLAEARARNAAPELKEALALVALHGGKLDGNRLGHWLRRNRDCRAGGLILVKTGEAGMGGGLKWKALPR